MVYREDWCMQLLLLMLLSVWRTSQLAIAAAIHFFFFQAEDGIRDYKVTGVQTCALPICQGRVGLAHGFLVARIAGDQARVVAEGLLVGVVGAELGRDLARHAVDVFGGRDLGDLARPALAGLDAEQVVGIAAIGILDFALAPAGLVSGLAQHEGGRNAAFLRHACSGVAMVGDEVVTALGRGRVGVDGLGRAAAAAAPGTCGAIGAAGRAAPGDAAHAQCGGHGDLGILGGFRAHGAGQLSRDGIRQAAGLARHGHRQLLVQHVGAQVALCAVEQAGLHGGLAHALDHLAHEQRFQLLGGFLRGLRTVLAGREFECVEGSGVGRQRIAGRSLRSVGKCDAHITSSSALRAPAALMACRMASRSWGVAPSVLSARTTSVSCGEPGMLMMLPGSCLIWMSDFWATTVWPCEKAPGWLITGVVLMVMARLPCAMAQGPRVTAWLSTMEPVRALITTLAEGLEVSIGISWISAIMRTRDPGSWGADTRTVRPSSACATPWPMRWLMARTTLSAVWKSVAFRPSVMLSPSLIGVGTARSTWAPCGTRPALRWLICTLEPPAEAPAPPTTRLPWASA